MPNIVGGSQDHPAYRSGRRLTEREVLIYNRLYTIVGDDPKVEVDYEDVDGRSGRLFDSSLWPPQVKRKITLLKKKQVANKSKEKTK